MCGEWTTAGTVILSNEAAIVELVATILLEQNDEWCVQRSRYMSLEFVAGFRGAHAPALSRDSLAHQRIPA
jgi:hypothetical protein